MTLKAILRPTMWKITAAFLIAAVSVFFIYLLNPYYRNALFSLDLPLRVLSISMSFLIVTAIYYPLACGVIFVCRNFTEKKKKKSRKDLTAAVLLILIFNPLTFSLVYSVSTYANTNIINYPCGVEIINFTGNSYARQVGMKVGEIIIQVNNHTIDTPDSLLRELAGKSPGEFIRVKTNLNEYDVQLDENPETRRPVMNIVIRGIYCKR